MTIADQLRIDAKGSETIPSQVAEHMQDAALELELRDDTIAQLRIERDTALNNAKALGQALEAAGNERDRMRSCLEDVLDVADLLDVSRVDWTAKIEAALKG